MTGLDEACAGQNLMSKLEGETGSFAIADLQGDGSSTQQHNHVQTQHLPDGKIALTLKTKDQVQG
jgi:hypothetical protein